MGSGSLAAMAVFESSYKDNLTVTWFASGMAGVLTLSALQEEEAKELVKNAIKAGIFNDLGSGSNVDLCVIRDVIASWSC